MHSMSQAPEIPDTPEQRAARDRVSRLLKKTGWTATQLARAAGIAPSTLNRFLAGGVKHTLSFKTLRKLDEAAAGHEKDEPAPRRPTQLEDLAPQLHPEEATELPSRTSMPNDVPVVGTAVGGNNGDFRFNGTEVDYVRRPPGLQRIKNAFAIYVYGDSMSPRFDHGELLYIHPGRPVSPGDYVLVELHGAEGEPGDCYVKRLVRRTADKLVLQQFNPPDDSIEVPLARVKAVMKILSPTELLGV